MRKGWGVFPTARPPVEWPVNVEAGGLGGPALIFDAFPY